jgi:hypothetical protein
MLRYLLDTTLYTIVIKQQPGSLLHGDEPSANDQAFLANPQPPNHPHSTPRLPYSPTAAPV